MRRLVIAVFLIVVICCMFVGTFIVTSAESSDTQSNSFITMNQQIQNNNFFDYSGTDLTGFNTFYTSDSSSAGSSLPVDTSITPGHVSFSFGSGVGVGSTMSYYSSTSTLIDGHKYYNVIRFSIDNYSASSTTATINLHLGVSNLFSLFDYHNGDFVYQSVNTFGSGRFVFYRFGVTVYSGKVSDGLTITFNDCSLIDLTAAFGAGNEPTIDECKTMFSSSYYPYDPNGTVVNLGYANGVNAGFADGYDKGRQDALDSLTYVSTPVYSFQSLQAMNIGDVSTTFAKVEQDNNYYFALDGYVRVPLPSSVVAGSTITVHAGQFYSQWDKNLFNLDFGYLFNNEFVSLYSVDPSKFGDLSVNGNRSTWTYDNASFTFQVPTTLSYFVIYASNDFDSSPTFTPQTTITDMYIELSSLNSSILENNAFNTGFEQGYSSGESVGYNNGYAAGIQTADSGTFLNLFSSVIQAPITALVGEFDSETGERVGGLLNFDFLGYNMSTLLMSLFSVGIVICVVRIFV